MFTLGLLLIPNIALAQEIDTSEFKRVIDYKVEHFSDTLKVIEYDSTLFLKEAYFQPALFDSKAYFGGSWFDSEAYFGFTQFGLEADFKSVQFDSMADFQSAQFDSKAYFSRTCFASEADFESAHFGSQAYFPRTCFASEADFESTHFGSQAYFSRIHFGSEAYFESAHFGSVADFSRTHFGSVADFSRTHFGSEAYFESAHFDSQANFYNAKFRGEVKLNACLLPDTLYFNNVKTEQEIDFTYALTDTIPGSEKRCVIDLYKTDISKIKQDYSRFRILRDSSRYQRRQLSNIYEQILKMQEEQGFIDGYKVADIEYKEFQLTYDRENPFLTKWFGITFSWGHFVNCLQKYWWNYGYAKEYIFFWIFGALCLFTLINAFLFRTLNEHVYKIKNIYPYRYHPPPGSSYKRSKAPDTGQSASPAVAGLERPTGKVLIMSFFYTSLIFFGLKMSVDRINFDRWGYALLLIVEYSFGLLCLAYLVNFIVN